jgi:hypothetical protein
VLAGSAFCADRERKLRRHENGEENRGNRNEAIKYCQPIIWPETANRREENFNFPLALRLGIRSLMPCLKSPIPKKTVFPGAPEGCGPRPRFQRFRFSEFQISSAPLSPHTPSHPAGKRPLRRNPTEGRKSEFLALFLAFDMEDLYAHLKKPVAAQRMRLVITGYNGTPPAFVIFDVFK